MQRIIAVPEDIPEGYEAVVMVFMEFNAKQNTGFVCKASNPLLQSLNAMPLDKQHKIIKTICSNIQLMLLQYSQNPGEVSVREI